MIPKLIHYSWFSGEEMPEFFVQIMETWKKYLPDYEFRLWDRKTLDEANLVFADEAISVKKWAFAADAIRVYAVYHYGGIWLDGDVAVYKSFDPFLHDGMFIGREHFVECVADDNFINMNTLTSHCFGAEKGHPFLKDCLEYYKDRHFITSSMESLPQGLRYDMRLLPSIQARIAKKYGYKGCVLDVNKSEILLEDIHVYPPYFFDSPKYESMDQVYCIHYKAGTWHPSQESRQGFQSIQVFRKKNLFYYMYTWANKLLAKRGFQIKVYSV